MLNSSQERNQDRASTRRYWLVALVLWLTVAAVSGAALWHTHESSLEHQLRMTDLISLALTDEMDRGLRGVQDGLNEVRSELRDDKALLLTGSGIERLLNRCARIMPLARKVWLTDLDGRLLSASDSTPPPDLRSFRPSLERISDKTAAVSRPFTDPATRESLVALAVRLDGPGSSTTGAAGGWLVAGIPATALFGTFSVASPGKDARMAVFRDDGVRLVGVIDETVTIDEPTMAGILDGRPSADRPGIVVRQFADGSERLVSLHSLPQYGLKLVLTRDMSVALKPWRNAALAALAGIALLLAVLVVAVRRLASADAQYAEAHRVLQIQRQRANKFEALTTMASGIAHDVNNVLAAILGFGEMAQDAVTPGSSQARHIDKVMQAALRGKALLARILTFSRSGAHHVTDFELEPIVEEVFSLLESSPQAGVTLEHRFDVAGARLRGDPTQAFEAVMNLCTNAVQAMPDGGVLSVRIGRLRTDAPRGLSHSLLPAGTHIALTVSDQGSGIAADAMEHLFEPFFTTRKDHAGTGLGLAVVHGVVGEFGGAIDVQSTPGKGSRFTVYFPECTEAPAPQRPLPEVAHATGGRRLMVVDDDPALVMLAEEILGGLGYEPVAFNDPVAALEALREKPTQFAAVITDEIMPKLCGTRFTEALRPSAPNLPVLLISGCGGAFLASRARAVGVTRVLSKPLQRAELERALAELLPESLPESQPERESAIALPDRAPLSAS